MESTTLDPFAGDVINDHDVDRSSSCPPAIASNMARENMAGDNSLKVHSPESYTPKDSTIESFIPGNHVSVDDAPMNLAPDHEAPSQQAPGCQTPEAYIINDHTIGKDTPELYMGVGDVHDRGKPDTYMEVDDAGGQYKAGDSLLRPIKISDSPTDAKFPRDAEFPKDAKVPKDEAPYDAVPAVQMLKFMQFPTEIRLMVWEMAIADSNEPDHPVFTRRVQRFRFNLIYDAQRVKPGQDKSWGWVACFTPLKINTNRPLHFLRASVDSRALLMRNMSVLTVHEQPFASGQHLAPRKCHMPFNFAKDDFCVEGITHALDEAKRDKEDKDAVWDPKKLPLADLLDNALGLRFAPRIKRLVIVPHTFDLVSSNFLWHADFIDSTDGRNLATLAKRFPALATVKSAIPQSCPHAEAGPSFSFGGYLLWKAASLRGRGLGGPSRMSEKDRDALYVTAWRRIFDRQYQDTRGAPFHLYNGYGCLPS